MKRGIVQTSILNFSYSDMIGLHRAGIQIGAPAPVTAADIKSFGMFGDGNNMNTFYPGLDKADFMPKPEDMVDVPFRILSATIVGANSWKATDFTNEKLLRDSVPMQNGQPIFFNHDQSVPNWLGVTINPQWQDSFSSPTGHKIPAGINGTYRIDAKSNPKIARGLVLGAIGSTSTTVKFDWVPSHTYDTPSEFYDKIGTVDVKDGKMVRRVVTKIHAYHENSLVWLGADPMAKKLDDTNTPIMPDFSSMHYSADKPLTFSAADSTEKKVYEEQKKFTIEYTIDNNIISLSQELNKKPKLTTTKNVFKMKKFLQAFLAAYGTGLGLTISLADDATELTPDQETALVAGLSKLALAPAKETVDAAKKVSDFVKTLKLVNAEGATVDFDVAAATTEAYCLIPTTEATRVYKAITDLTPLADAGKKHISFKRDEAIRFYKLSMGDKFDEEVVNLMKAADAKALDGLLKLHTKGATEKFAPVCTKCGNGESIEMRSSFVEGDNPAPDVTTGNRPLSVQEMAASKSKAGMFIGRGMEAAAETKK